MKNLIIKSTLFFSVTVCFFSLSAITAEAGATAPTDPVISGYAPTAVVGVTYSVSFTSTDSDGDNIRYNVDWNNDGISDACIPGGTYVASGVTETGSYTWSTAGSKTFQVRAIDVDGNTSSWVPVTVTINTPPIPTVTTQSSTAVMATSTTLRGNANPNNNSTTAWFRYSATNPGTCNDTFGTRVGVSSLGSGSSAVSFSFSLTGLTAGTEYWYCAIASSTGGVAYGAVMSRLTAPSTPTGLTATPSAVCGSGTINTSWNTSPTAYCYQIELDGVPTCNGNSTTYSHTGLADASAHTYRVRSNNGSYSLWSAPVYANAPASCSVADLVSESLSVSAGPYLVGQSLTLNAQVRNSGGASTGVAFDDNFSYSYTSATGPWTNLTPLVKSTLVAGALSNDVQTLSLSQSGTLYIQHCVDSNNEVSELSGETPNCTVSSGMTVNPTPTGNISANPASLNGGGTSTISWNSSSASACIVSSLDAGNTDSWSALSSSGEVTAPLYGDTTYALVCDGIAVSAVPISVTNIPELTLTNRVVESGSQTVLSWNTHNGDEGACTLSGGQQSDIIPSTSGDPNRGSATITVDAMTTYTLSCPSGGDVITVEVVPVGFEQ